MNNPISLIRKPIEKEFNDYLSIFNSTLSHQEELQNTIFEQMKRRGGKRLRPTLTILIAKAIGEVNESTLHAATAIELLHTASLVHDDVVDNSDFRRGETSVNHENGNKIAVLVGDYILSTALRAMAATGNADLVSTLALEGRILADGEIKQLVYDKKLDLNYSTYLDIIYGKTASLFETACIIAAKTVNADENKISWAKKYGNSLGIMFQIKDDIFDYLPTKELGKPAAKDMREGKLTLPVLYILNNFSEKEWQKSGVSREKTPLQLAQKVKTGAITDEEIAFLIDYTVKNGGIEYAEQTMQKYAAECYEAIENLTDKEEIKQSLRTLVEFVIKRES